MEWCIVYEKYCKAVDVVYGTVETYTDYRISCQQEIPGDKSFVYVGFDKSLDDGFCIKVYPENEGKQRIDILAADEINLMYAAQDFKNKYLPFAKNTHITTPKYYFNKLFYEPMKEYDIVSKPRIKERGIWTWGYVIYDYKKFIDNMVSLKLNTLIIWNDYTPLNIKDVIDYAHKNGVKIHLGFAWGWDTSFDDISNPKALIPKVLDTYEKEYAHLDCDGIYFQSFTEVKGDNIGGISIAEAVTDFVNEVGAIMLEKYKDLRLLFGLHATSVKNKLDVIKNVDNRLEIIWEDAGAFPYSYIPYDVESFDETKAFNIKIRDLRTGGFGAVLKGVTCLDWTCFSHQPGSFVLGESDKQFIKNRTEVKKDVLRYIQAYWIKNAKYAHELIKDFNEDSMVTVLAEDGVFEEVINYPMALYAEMMWDSGRSTDDIMCETALRPDVDFI